MGLFLLKPINDPSLNLSLPIHNRWHGNCFSIIVRANSETEAREIADTQDDLKPAEFFWLDTTKSECVFLESTGEPELLVADIYTHFQ